ncbi:unnamed protein product [Brassicogethes aeneus]|uniref:G-protein coupled receptors family 1 profile domain-containing protein n=1 Tax=Brassicogethes aeneus TaxID=1431903 RepID=A0A9P0ARV1_BRAAE|nr:unnamed protein product [Brassicogethes aeneus]
MNNSTEINETIFLEEDMYLGGKLWLALNLFLTASTLAGNILTMAAIIYTKKLSGLVANQFIFSLAVSDLLVGLSIPYHMAFYWVNSFGNSQVKCLLRFALISFAMASSILNLLCIATDRYLAIVYPFLYTRYMTRRTSLVMIVFVWSLSFSIILTIIFWNDWQEGVSCEIIKVLPEGFINFFVCPLFATVWVILLFLYSRICREATGHAKRIRSTNSVPNVRDSKSFQVMIIILGCFSVCWLPFFVVLTYARTTGLIGKGIYEISFTLAVANSGMNPLIYAWKNANFRKAFSCLLRCQRPNVCSAAFVTNHVPSKKNSMNGICNGKEEDLVRSEFDIELQSSKLNGICDQLEQCQGSVPTQVTNVNASPRN